MLLDNKYFKMASMQKDGNKACCNVLLLPDCNVYEGHFPGRPVCPGVCNIETIKECAMMVTGEKLHISSIRQCRLTAVATPTKCPQLNILLETTPTENGFSVKAEVKDEEQVYMDFKGEMIKA